MGNSNPSTANNDIDHQDDRIIVLNEVFANSVSIIIIDYLNPLYGFQDTLFEMKAEYNDNQYWDIWQIFLTINNKNGDELVIYDDSTKSIKTTAQYYLLIIINKDLVQYFY